MALNNFNYVASYYDSLAKFIFGSLLIESQVTHLNCVKCTDKVLILGGGTGQILDFLPNCAGVYFLDKSSKMLDLAMKESKVQDVVFIQEDFLEWNIEQKFDVVICPFFLDCFDRAALDVVVKKIKSMIHFQGRLIVTDFDLHRTPLFLLKAMHVFFRVFASLGTKNLQPIKAQLSRAGFFTVSQKNFKKGIFSTVYSME